MHSESTSKLYHAYISMKARCSNPKNNSYHNYGGRGITVCPEWEANSSTFIDWALSHGWQPGLEIDRIDVNGNYTPDNCRFVTHTVNSRNKRYHRRITAWGETKLLCEWTEDARCKVPHHSLLQRLKNGWSPEDAISSEINCGSKQPPECRKTRSDAQYHEAFGERKTLLEVLNDDRCIVNENTLRGRIGRRGWEFETALTTRAEDQRFTDGHRSPKEKPVTIWNETKCLSEWLRDARCQVTELATLTYRIRAGWEPEKALTTPARIGKYNTKQK